jgi:hypothetical protein
MVARISPFFTLSPTLTFSDLTIPLELKDKSKSVFDVTCPVASTVCFRSTYLAVSVIILTDVLAGFKIKGR